ncbi:hypothetical protein PUN28_008477 [Cardiocondyla obscurior]|uniref:Uncharacterized protein n=1 Tax=Cardiocondyla obscurior TaxID=286306 RepID=A0AAW2G0R9_9HYME
MLVPLCPGFLAVGCHDSDHKFGPASNGMARNDERGGRVDRGEKCSGRGVHAKTFPSGETPENSKSEHFRVGIHLANEHQTNAATANIRQRRALLTFHRIGCASLVRLILQTISRRSPAHGLKRRRRRVQGHSYAPR